MFTTTILKVSHNNPQKISDAVVLSKNEVDDLVKKAAQQKYLQDVFNDGKTLPIPKSKNISLQPYLLIFRRSETESWHTVFIFKKSLQL